MAMNIGAAKAPWYGALIAAASIAGVTVVTLAQDRGFDFWIGAVVVSVFGGVASALWQAGRNRRLDLAAEQARAAGNGPAMKTGPR